MPPTIYDIIEQLQQQAQPRPDLMVPGSTGEVLSMPRPATYQGKVVLPGMSLLDVLSQMPTQAAEEGSRLLPTLGLAGMAKRMSPRLAFTPGATTFAQLVDDLVNAEEVLYGRGRLIPVIRHPKTLETFEGTLGGYHPSNLMQEILTKRGETIPGSMQYGFRPNWPNAPFVPEQLVTLMTLPGGPEKVQKLLKKGMDIDKLISIMREGAIYR